MLRKAKIFTPVTELLALSFISSFVFFQVVEYETMSKDVNRSAYTRRILEIVGNIKKQKEEINKVGGCPVQLLSLRFCQPVCYLVGILLPKCLLFSSHFFCFHAVDSHRHQRCSKGNKPIIGEAGSNLCCH